MSKLNKGRVEEIVQFIGTYTADIIRKGSMEAVMLPYFGKFRPKVKKLFMKDMAEAGRKNGLEAVNRAILGKRTLTTKSRT